jgi:hypothetical protein
MPIKAGAFAEYDPVNGVSANIMLGQIPPCGTGDSTIMIDEEKLFNIEPAKMGPAPVHIDMAETCTLENLGFDFSLNIPSLSQPGAMGSMGSMIDLNIM